jgi:pyrroloquinoline quinone (PQQ) biosynthesis protein C
MKPQEWRKKTGDIARNWIQSQDLKNFFSVKFTRERAKMYISQLSHYVHNRRNCWSYVMAGCPEIDVKQRILGHEFEEMVKDEYSDHGHLDLIFRQAKALGLSQDEVLSAPRLPITMAATNGWLWIAAHRPWQAALAASTSMELENDNRLLDDLGGGKSKRLLGMWQRDLGLRHEQMPGFVAHSKADEKHSDMFLDVLEAHVPAHMEDLVLKTVKESFDIYAAYLGGLAKAMERLN